MTELLTDVLVGSDGLQAKPDAKADVILIDIPPLGDNDIIDADIVHAEQAGDETMALADVVIPTRASTRRAFWYTLLHP